MSTATLSSHVLDLARGAPAVGLAVELRAVDAGDLDAAHALATGSTDDDGRVSRWDPQPVLAPGIYELIFATGDWFAARGERSFYPDVRIRFEVSAGDTHYHVPLLLNRFGYSTYRGS